MHFPFKVFCLVIDQGGGLHINDTYTYIYTYLIAHEVIYGWHSFPHDAGDTAYITHYNHIVSQGGGKFKSVYRLLLHG